MSDQILAGSLSPTIDDINGTLSPDQVDLDANLVDASQSVSGNLSPTFDSLDGIITPTDVVIFGELSSNTPNVFAQLQMNTGETTSNYNYLYNKPSIEGVTLVGDKTFEELNLVPLSNADLARILT